MMFAKDVSGINEILRNTPIQHALHVKLGIEGDCLCRKSGWLSEQVTDEQIAGAVAGFPDHVAVCSYMTDTLGVRGYKVSNQ